MTARRVAPEVDARVSPVFRNIRLKTRFMLVAASMLFVLMVVIAVAVERRFTASIRKQVRARGLAVAESIAAVCTNPLLTYNYVALEQNAEQASQGEDIAYVIILDKEGRVAAFSDHDNWQGRELQDPVNARVLAATQPVVQNVWWAEKEERVLDVAVPVYIPDSEVKWGTVRVGLSLEPMYLQLRQTRMVLVIIGLVALVFGLAGAHVLAGRITQPLAQVVNATIAAAAGDLDQQLEVRTGDEVEELARNFNAMIAELKAQRSELERRLEEILQLKRYSDMILTSMSNGVLTVDMEGRLVSTNKAARTMLGLGEDEWQGAHYLTLWPDGSSLAQLIRRGLEEMRPEVNREIVLVDREGRARTLIANVSVLGGRRGEAMGVLAVLNDVTELKEMEARVRQADRLAALGTLSAGLAHEIRNPLSAIKTFVQLLPRKIDSPGFLEKFQITVPRELNRINDLIESLLELARPPKMKFGPVSPLELIHQVADLYRAELERAGITLEIRSEQVGDQLWADGEHLIRAFSNVVMNARQAMVAGGRLKIEIRQIRGEIFIEFEDTGAGMDEKTVENIFNPFFTTKDKGTGLGLAITHKIIEEHGGSIQVSSTMGKGSRFTFCLPAMKT